MFGGTGRPGAYQSIGFGQTADAVFLPGFSLTGGLTGDIKLVDAWGVRGAYNHNWDPYWSSSLWGSYSSVRYGGNHFDILTAKGQVCASFNFGKVRTFRLYLQPRLQHCPGWRCHPLDSRQEPDVLG